MNFQMYRTMVSGPQNMEYFYILLKFKKIFTHRLIVIKVKVVPFLKGKFPELFKNTIRTLFSLVKIPKNGAKPRI